jgi:hypothetical protein
LRHGVCHIKGELADSGHHCTSRGIGFARRGAGVAINFDGAGCEFSSFWLLRHSINIDMTGVLVAAARGVRRGWQVSMNALHREQDHNRDADLDG